jgi:hypothetical protein
VDDRAFSASRNLDPGEARADLVTSSPLPAETGPMWAPDELSVWPLEGGAFGLDARYVGPTGRQRAEHQVRRLAAAGIQAKVRRHDDGAAVRLGPVAHGAAWVALEAFLGRPVPPATGAEVVLAEPDDDDG